MSHDDTRMVYMRTVETKGDGGKCQRPVERLLLPNLAVSDFQASPD